METGGTDDPAGAIGLGDDDRPSEPRLRARIHLEVRDPELEEVVELVGQVRRDGRPDLCRGRVEVAGQEMEHERHRHRHQLDSGRTDRRDVHRTMVASAVIH